MIERTGRVAAVTAAAVLAFAGVADARQSPDVFDGSCEFDGSMTFTPPVGTLPAAGGWAFDASGPCEGTLNGEAVSATPAEFHIAGPGDLGCGASVVPEGSPGNVTFSRGTRRRSDDVVVEFRFGTFVQVAVSSIPWHATGAVSGDLVGISTFPGDQQIVESCAGGTLGTIPSHVSARTVRPLVG
ncbi:MAG TPA: hypothetical protein VF520_05495 [Thermoleophilaceae bacterium]